MAPSYEEEHLISSIRVRRKRNLSRTEWLLLIVFTISLLIALITFSGRSETHRMTGYHVKYSTVPGYFLQDDPETDPVGFDYTATNFGLNARSYQQDTKFDVKKDKTQWQKFENEVKRLNQESDQNTVYKVLFLGRHGEGYHNVAEAYYGTAAWDCYWSLQDGNETSTWVDAHLTPTGEAQAVKAHDFWASLIKTQKIPFPEIYYISPLRRCLATGTITFHDLPLPAAYPFKPIIKELFREVIGVHTCDKRSSKTTIRSEWPGVVFEEGFVEEDELFSAELRETDGAIDQRSKKALDSVFRRGEDGYDKTWISFSIHSGIISSLLRVLGHRIFSLGTGQVIPVLIKVEYVDGKEPQEDPVPWERITPCAKPPPPAIKN